MNNLAAIVTRDAIIEALDEAIRLSPKFRKATKFHLVYKDLEFPPKEVVRMAASKMGITKLNRYRLAGGKSTNRHLENLGFDIVQFADWNNRQQKVVSSNSVANAYMTRLAYNDNGWISPSGWDGKSKTKGLHESKHGFGHEEWLFDFSQEIGGCQYGFIEGFRTKNNLHGGKTIEVLHLFTKDSRSKNKFWVAEIRNCYVLTNDEQKQATILLSQNGMTKQKIASLKEVKLWDVEAGKSVLGFSPNVRFAKEDAVFFDPWLDVSPTTFTNNRDRYRLFEVGDLSLFTGYPPFDFDTAPKQPNTKLALVRRKQSQLQSREVAQMHRQLCTALGKNLAASYGETNLRFDVPTGTGTYIDIVRRSRQGYILYEVKTYNDLRKNIRESLGQLLEYAYWRQDKQVAELVIVTEQQLDAVAKGYLQFLKSEFGLSVSHLVQKI